MILQQGMKASFRKRKQFFFFLYLHFRPTVDGRTRQIKRVAIFLRVIRLTNTDTLSARFLVPSVERKTLKMQKKGTIDNDESIEQK